jgi:hypothetical protein
MQLMFGRHAGAPTSIGVAICTVEVWMLTRHEAGDGRLP